MKEQMKIAVPLVGGGDIRLSDDPDGIGHVGELTLIQFVMSEADRKHGVPERDEE